MSPTSATRSPRSLVPHRSSGDLEEGEGGAVCRLPAILPFKKRIAVLFVAVAIQFGSHLVKQIAALKPYFSGDPEWSPPIDATRWGWFQSGVTFPTLVLPIVGGILVDTSWGVKAMSAFMLFLTCVGQLLFWFAAVIHNFPLAVGGRAVLGLGQGCISSLTATIAALYFPTNLMFSIGLTESFHALSVWLSKASSAPVSEYFGDYRAALLYGEMWCAFSFVVGFAWYFVDRKEDITDYDGDALRHAWREKRRRKAEGVRMGFSLLRSLPLNFYLVCFLHLLFSNAHRVFGHIDAAFLQSKYGYSKTKAGFQASITEIFGIFGAPLLGLFIDRISGSFRSRALPLLLTLSASCGCVSYSALAFFIPPGEDPSWALRLLGVCNAITPTVLRAAVPGTLCGRSRVPASVRRTYGTAYGVFEVVEAGGVFVAGWLVGVLVDMEGGEYSSVVGWFSLSLFLAVLSSLILFLRSSSPSRHSSLFLLDSPEERFSRPTHSRAEDREERGEERRRTLEEPLLHSRN